MILFCLFFTPDIQGKEDLKWMVEKDQNHFRSLGYTADEAAVIIANSEQNNASSSHASSNPAPAISAKN
ncbi:MAG: hypothetical protein M1561_04535 [Gammaproteobacteria bacterium]|nr:hypothetical protein [Gammaproteobacteria bacterium]